MPSDQLVRDVVAQLLDLDEDDLTMDTAFADIDGWDSVNALRILVYLERELGTSIDYDGFTRAHTLAELSAVVNSAQAAEQGSRP